MVNFLIHRHFISLPISVYLLWGLFSSAFATLFFYFISLSQIGAYCYILLNIVIYCYIFCYILSHIVTYCYIYSYKTKTFVSFLIWFCTYSSIRLNSFSNTLVNPSNQTRLFMMKYWKQMEFQYFYLQILIVLTTIKVTKLTSLF